MEKKKSKAARRKRQTWFRIAVQAAFFTVLPSVYHSAFTAVKNTVALFRQGMPLELNEFSIQFLVLIALTILFGRFFCGWACAFGAVNDWIYMISKLLQKKLHKKLSAIPDDMIAKLQRLKYMVLAGILSMCFCGKGSVVSRNSPWTVFALLRSGRFQLSGFEVGLAVLILLVIGMAFQERFFCQFLCPLGAVFSLLPQIPAFGLKRNTEKCPARCGACKRNCPVNLLLETDSMRQGECIRCGRCVMICPKDNIRIRFTSLFEKKMKKIIDI